MILDLNSYQLLTIFVASLVIILAASEIGRVLGVRSKTRGGDDVYALVSAVLGLVALLIAFTFAMALSRFEARRDAVVNEANAIGTTALRARLLPAPHSTDVLNLLKEYVRIRLDLERTASEVDVDAVIARSNEIQETVWQHAKAIAANDPRMVPTGLFIQTLNEMIDSQGNRLAAIRARLPNFVLTTLYAMAILASALAGYANGLETRLRLPVYVVGLLVSIMILLIQDLDRPGAGFIESSQQPMIDLATSIAAYVDP
jgi:hypothetical protein